MSIEELWEQLRRQGGGAQRRIDATHPVDLYADYEIPNRPGLVVFTDEKPPEAPRYQAIETETRRRADGRWSLRISLTDLRLLQIFSQLCSDIIQFARIGIDPERAAGPILMRVERWHSLLQSRSAGLSDAELRGLIGELYVLANELISPLGKDVAVAAWTGPLGTPQDFQLPNGERLEVKTAAPNTNEITINGLQQLDSGSERLQLLVVRLEATGRNAADALTARSLIHRIRAELDDAPVALATFERLLLFSGWNDTVDNDRVSVRVARLDRHDVDQQFPKLVASNVPVGIVDVIYRVILPAG